MEQDKSFLFSPGEEIVVPAGQPGAGQTVRRGAYSTNAYSLIGLALTGLFELDEWTQLDQRSLAWGSQPTMRPCSPHAALA